MRPTCHFERRPGKPGQRQFVTRFVVFVNLTVKYRDPFRFFSLSFGPSFFTSFLRKSVVMAVPYKVPLAPTQKDSRGFFRGPADETPWNNDRSWIQHGLYFCFEKLQVQFVTHAVFFHFSERLSKNCLDFKQTIQNPAATKSSVRCYMRYCFGNMDSIFHKG